MTVFAGKEDTLLSARHGPAIWTVEIFRQFLSLSDVSFQSQISSPSPLLPLPSSLPTLVATTVSDCGVASGVETEYSDNSTHGNNHREKI